MLTLEKLKEREERLRKEWIDLKNKGNQMSGTLKQMETRINEIAGAIVEIIDMEKEMGSVETPSPVLEATTAPSENKPVYDPDLLVDTAFTKSKKDKK